jgi:hypothetical protein
MGDFLAFRRFLTPVFIQVIFWIGVVAIALGLLISGIIAMTGGTSSGVIGGLLMILIGIPLGLIYWRVVCEIMIVGFRMLDAMQSIDQKMR